MRGPTRAKRTILVVDDEPDMLSLLEAVLSLQFPAYQVVTAATGPAAIEAIEGTPPDLMVSDYLMPGPNGLEVAQQLRDRGHRFPIVIITAFVDSGLRERVEASGLVQAFLRKPVEPGDLSRVVQGLLDGPGHQRAPPPPSAVTA